MYKIHTNQEFVPYSRLDQSPSSQSSSFSLDTCSSQLSPPASLPMDWQRHGGILSSAVKGSNYQLHAANELLRLSIDM